MGLFGAKEPKPHGYRGAYREEVLAQKEAAVKRQVREDVRRDLTPRSERIKGKVRRDLEGIHGSGKKFYGKSGSITIKKDALGRLKRLGKGRYS